MLFSINVHATAENFDKIYAAIENTGVLISDSCFTSVDGYPIFSAMCTADLTNIEIVAAMDSCAQDHKLIIHSLLTGEGLTETDVDGYKGFTTDNNVPFVRSKFLTPAMSRNQSRHIMETKIPVHLSKYTQEFKSLMMNHTEYFIAVSEIPKYIWDDVILPVWNSEQDTILLNFEHYDGSTMCSLRIGMNGKTTGEIMDILAEYDFDLADIEEDSTYRVQLNYDFMFPKSKFLKSIRALAVEGLFIEQFETDLFVFRGSELSNLVCKEPFEQFVDTYICNNCLCIDGLGIQLRYEDTDTLTMDRSMLKFLLKGKLN